MAARHWKFVGGDKSPRTSLNAATAAVQKDNAGETAIFNCKTGELYDLLGDKYPPLVRHQYDKVIQVLSLIVVHHQLGVPIDPKNLLPIITQVGGPVLEDVKGQAGDLAIQLKRLTEAAEDGSSGPIESNNQV